MLAGCANNAVIDGHIGENGDQEIITIMITGEYAKTQ